MAIVACLLSAGAFASDEPITLKSQGSFAAGGSSVKHDGEFSPQKFLAPDGQRAYGDHAYVFYQIPMNARKYPLIFQHGGAASKRTWETTPDGREGFQNIFLRKGYSVYLLDQPRIGEAGLALVPDDGRNPYAANPMYADKVMIMLCRMGVYDGDTPKIFDNAAFPKDSESIEQFLRTCTPYTGQLDDEVSSNALAALFKKTGPGILVTHSMGGTVGWLAQFKTENIKAIVSFEPGGSPFVFPAGELPEPVTACYPPVSARAVEVPLEDFEKLTRIPIVLYFGDFIAPEPTDEVGPDKWRTEMTMARRFVEAVNRHGGNAELVHLPEVGIKGNTHFIMGDTNNQEVADLMAKWLHEHGLD